MGEGLVMLVVFGIAAFAIASRIATKLATDKREQTRRRLLRRDLYSGETIRRAPNKRTQRKILAQFLDQYGLYELPPAISWYVRDLGVSNVPNYYILSFPKWRYETKTGARDRRRNGNALICDNSVLYAGQLIFTTPSPTRMIRFVNELRAHGCPIDLNDLEKRKINSMQAARSRQMSLHTVASTVAAFEENPTEFEQFCARLFRKMGFFVEVTPKTNDGGYDLFMRRQGSTFIAECKCYKPETPIGRPMLQKLVGANAIKQADVMMFITTSRFSGAAVEYGRKFHMHLIDGEQLIAMMNRYMPPATQGAPMMNAPVGLMPADLAPYFPPDVKPEMY